MFPSVHKPIPNELILIESASNSKRILKRNVKNWLKSMLIADSIPCSHGKWPNNSWQKMRLEPMHAMSLGFQKQSVPDQSRPHWLQQELFRLAQHYRWFLLSSFP